DECSPDLTAAFCLGGEGRAEVVEAAELEGSYQFAGRGSVVPEREDAVCRWGRLARQADRTAPRDRRQRAQTAAAAAPRVDRLEPGAAWRAEPQCPGPRGQADRAGEAEAWPYEVEESREQTG